MDNLNWIQKAARWAFSKAVGFPSWNLTGPWPGGYASLDALSGQPMELSAVYGCTRVLSGTVGSLPWEIYRRDKNGDFEEYPDHPLWRVLHDSPNTYMTSMEYREALVTGFCLYGNAYALIGRIGKRIVSLTPLRSDRTRPIYLPPDYSRLVYRYSHFDGRTEDYQPEDIIHVKNFSMDGLIGLSPIRKYVFDHALAAQAYGRNFFRNMGRPSGVLSSDQAPPANEEAAKKMRADWDLFFGGTDNAGKTAVLWKGLKYEPISVPPEDAQYILTRQLSTAEIAGGIYGVPLNMLGHTDKTATYASAEQFDIQFAKHTVRPLDVRIEQAHNKKLFPMEPDVFCKLDMDELMRGDSAAQASYFGSMTQNGIISRNEARRSLGKPRVENADELTVQSNLIDLDKLASVTNRAAAPNQPVTPPAGGQE